MRILVIEDDIVIADQLSRFLEREKYLVDVRRNGIDGEEAALGGNYGLIVLDIMLPERDGWTVCDNLRRHKVTTPILMLASSLAIESIYKLGCDCIRGLLSTRVF